MFTRKEMLNIRYSVFNLFEERSYVAWREPGRCVLIDPGCRNGAELQALTDLLTQEALTPEAILLTHGHMDHIFGVKPLQDRYGIPAYMHPADTAALDYNPVMAERFRMQMPEDFDWTPLQEGQLEVAGITITVHRDRDRLFEIRARRHPGQMQRIRIVSLPRRRAPRRGSDEPWERFVD